MGLVTATLTELTPVAAFAAATGIAYISMLAVMSFIDADRARSRARFAEELGKTVRAARKKLSLFNDTDLAAAAIEDPLPPDIDLEAFDLPTVTATPPLSVRWEDYLRQANLRITLRQLIGSTVGLALACAVLGAVVGGVWGGVMLAALGGVALPMGVLFLRNQRQDKLVAQLPEAFELMARAIRSGHAIGQAFQAVADTMKPPIAQEFARCQEQQNLGLLPEVAFRNMAERWDVLELRIFVMAMVIQMQAGGKLSEVLERLATLMRERMALRRRVQSLTAEGRMQAVVLVILPPFTFCMMWMVNPGYAEALFEQKTLLAVTIVAMTAGVLWIRRIVNFKAY
jgi:tight adherence protein B